MQTSSVNSQRSSQINDDNCHVKVAASLQQFEETYRLTSCDSQPRLIDTVVQQIRSSNVQSQGDCFVDSTIAGLYQIFEMNTSCPDDHQYLYLHIVITNGRDFNSKNSKEVLENVFKGMKEYDTPQLLVNHFFGFDIDRESEEEKFLMSLSDLDSSICSYYRADSIQDLKIENVVVRNSVMSQSKAQSQSGGGIRSESDINKIYMERSFDGSSRIMQKLLLVFNVQLSNPTGDREMACIRQIVKRFLDATEKRDLVAVIIPQPSVYYRASQGERLMDQIRNNSKAVESKNSFSIEQQSVDGMSQQQQQKPRKNKSHQKKRDTQKLISGNNNHCPNYCNLI